MDLGIWTTQLRKGLLEFCILNVLARGETYGYAVVQELKRIDGQDLREGTIYPILHRLRREGYLGARRSPSENGPPRRYFILTKTGKARLRQMRAHWQALTRSVAALCHADPLQERRSSRADNTSTGEGHQVPTRSPSSPQVPS